MKTNIDQKLESVKDFIPKVNSNLCNKIYYEATSKKEKNNSFLKLSFMFALPTIMVSIFALFIGVRSIFLGNINQTTNEFNTILNLNSQPPLSSTNINTFDFTATFGQINKTYDVITVKIDNALHKQVIYLTSYDTKILNITLNNGNIDIEKIIIDDVDFYKLTIYNYNSNVHFINIHFEIGTLNDKTTSNVNLLALTTLKKPYKSYEFNLQLDKIIYEGEYNDNE